MQLKFSLKLKNISKKYITTALFLSAVTCTAPETVRAQVFCTELTPCEEATISGTPNPALSNYNFKINTLTQDVDRKPNNNRGRFPGALQNLTGTIEVQGNVKKPLFNIRTVSLVSSSFTTLPLEFERQEFQGIIQEFGGGAKYEATFHSSALKKLTLFVKSANPNDIPFLAEGNTAILFELNIPPELKPSGIEEGCRKTSRGFTRCSIADIGTIKSLDTFEPSEIPEANSLISLLGAVVIGAIVVSESKHSH